jgi:hypothetical protein
VKKLFQRRFPTYLTGFVIGMTLVVLLAQIKRAMAPKVVDIKDERTILRVAPKGHIRVRFAGDPEKNLAPGYPSQLYLGKRRADGQFTPESTLGLDRLLEKELLLGPLETGEYEIRTALYACESPAAPVCARILVVQPVIAAESPTAGAEEVLEVDLRSSAQRALESARAERP